MRAGLGFQINEEVLEAYMAGSLVANGPHGLAPLYLRTQKPRAFPPRGFW